MHTTCTFYPENGCKPRVLSQEHTHKKKEHRIHFHIFRCLGRDEVALQEADN